MAFLIFYVTCPDETTAKDIGRAITERRLAACANIFPIQSAYWWAGALENENEWALILKTKSALEHALETALLDAHPYDVPCITRFEARANAAYEAWIESTCREI